MFRTTKTSILIISIFSLCSYVSSNEDCAISINKDLKKPQPLLLVPRIGNEVTFYVPTKDDLIKVKDGKTIRLACPKASIQPEIIDEEIVEIKCKNDEFWFDENPIKINEISCNETIESAAFLSGNCLENYREIQIGFFIDEISKFVQVLSVCFDETQENALYSKFDLTKFINGSQRNVARISFIQDNFYTIENVNELYKRKNQKKTINKLLGIEDSNSEKYVKGEGDFFLSRGHLTAMRDFVFADQQLATFYFVNVAPQWQIFNDGNWRNVEEYTRNFATKSPRDLTIYTGTFGILTYPHEDTQKPTELFLGNNKIPVPKFYWKVLYDEPSESAIAFVGINDPYLKELTDKEVFCEDICDYINDLNFERKNFTKGYVYCCEIGDFRKTVWNLPEFEVKTVLGMGKWHRTMSIMAQLKAPFMILSVICIVIGSVPILYFVYSKIRK